MIDYNYGVQLGALNSTHCETIREWRNCASIMRWCRQSDLISDGEQARWFESQDKDPSIKMYSIYGGGSFVGVCGFTSIQPIARHAEFSLYIAPKFQRKGCAKGTLKTLFTHGFKSLGLSQIWGETLEGNPALKIFEAMGMKIDGVKRAFYFKQGRFQDATLVSMTRAEFDGVAWNTP